MARTKNDTIDLEKLLGKSSNSIWDQYVPIITEKNHTRAYITDQIDEPSLYNELCYKLKSASPAEVFTLYINTPGGIIDSAVMLIDAIKTSKAKVTAEISGTVASAGTIITLACDDVNVADHTSFMIHNYSAGAYGKGHELKARQTFIDNTLNASFKEFYKGFLTEQEMDEVIEGKDMWMDAEEVRARVKGTFHKKITATSEDTFEDELAAKTRRGRPRKVK